MKELKEYVCQQIGCVQNTPDDENYRKHGWVDSLGLVRLVLTLESKYGIVFTDGDVSDTAFNTIGGLVSIIGRKLEEKNHG